MAKARRKLTARSKSTPSRANVSKAKPRPSKAKAASPKAKVTPSKAKARPAATRKKSPSRPATAKARPAPKAVTRAGASSKSATTVRGGHARRPVPVVPPPPPRRSTYVDALAAYERGIQALQARKYREAAEILRSVIAQYPEEKELHERAALYVRVCERQIATAPAVAETPEDRVYAATLALNNGAIDQAVSLLSSVVASDADHDQATYMLGVAYALRGNTAAAIQHLARSMALNPENRDLARKEPDLDPLRRTDEMRALLAAPPTPLPRRDKRPVRRGKK